MSARGFGNRYMIPELVNVAKQYGWVGVADLDLDDNPDFISALKFTLQRKILFRDPQFRGSVHSMDGHFFQLVLASRVLMRKAGPEAVTKFFEHIMVDDAFWYFLFDRGPVHHRDFRGPSLFIDAGIAGYLDLN